MGLGLTLSEKNEVKPTKKLGKATTDTCFINKKCYASVNVVYNTCIHGRNGKISCIFDGRLLKIVDTKGVCIDRW